MLRLIALRKILLQNSLYIFFLIIGTLYALICINCFERKSIYNENDTNFILRLDSFTIEGNNLSIVLNGKENLIANYIFEEEKNIETFLNTYSIGDTLLIIGTLSIPRNNTIPNTFNYKKYLYNKGIFYTLKIEKFSKIKDNKNVLYLLKDYLYKKCYKSINRNYYYTFLLGSKKYIKEEYFNSYSTNGISHLFSLSGLHVSLFASIIFSLLKKLKIGELSKYIFTFIVLLILCFVTAFTPSITRATIFFFLLGINKVYYFYIKSENVLILVYFILVLINPFIIMDLGFQLSFIITYFILINLDNMKDKRYISSIFNVSLISFLVSLPIIVNNFYTVNILSIFINIFFVPLVSYIVYPFSLLTFIMPFLDKIFYLICSIMEYVSLIFSKTNFLVFNIPKISIYLIIFYYIFLIIIYRYKYNKNIYYLLIVFVILINNFLVRFNNNYYIYFLDVGQGDSIFIKTPFNRKTILIDVSGKMSYEMENWKIRNKKYSIVKNSVIPFFKSIGINKIDYLFLTHGDDDHAGEANNLINNFKVKKVFINKGNVNVLESKIPNKKVIDNNSFIVDNVVIYSLNDKIYGEENDNSIVLLVIINNYKILLMGDASKKTEMDIIKKYHLNDIDVLKIGHHGSKTSSSENFIKTVKPKTCVISVGLNNRFNHPSFSVLDTLNKYNCSTYRTDENGSIIFKINENKINIQTIKP